jgi:AmmeMemoRadiSam system protein A
MNPYLQLAKSATESFVKQGKIIQPPQDLPQELKQQKAGVFISIHKGKKLWGCIGTYLPTKKNIAQEIIANAVSASQDPRFFPVQEEELTQLNYQVYILERPELVEDIKTLNPKIYGIIVKTESGLKSALVLPGLEGIDSSKKQLSIACQKGGVENERPQRKSPEISSGSS